MMQFDLNFLPTVLKPWIGDIAERMQCPPEYVAIAAVTGLSSLIGRRVGLKPKAMDDWIEIPKSLGGDYWSSGSHEIASDDGGLGSASTPTS